MNEEHPHEPLSSLKERPVLHGTVALPSTAAIRRRLHDTDQRLIWSYYVGVSLLYIVLVATGVTTSSIGALSPSGATDNAVIAGTPREIRSDEFLRASPERIGLLRDADASLKTPFDFTGGDDFLAGRDSFLAQLIALGAPDYFVIEKVFYLLPIDSGFAAFWWLYTYLALLGLPTLLMLVGVRPGFAIPGALIAVLSSANAWWSEWPLVPIGIASIGALLVLLSIRSTEWSISFRWVSWAVTAALAIAAGSFAARLPFVYQPWSIPVALVFTGLVIGFLITVPSFSWPRRLVPVCITLAVALGLSAAQLLQTRDLYQTLADTVYPGARRSAGSGEAFTWAGSVVWNLQLPGGDALAFGNQSELAIGFVALLLMVPFLILGTASNRRRSPEFGAALGSGAMLIVCLSWVSAEWPSWALAYNPLVFVPTPRMTQILGPLAVIGFILALQAYKATRHPVSTRALLVAAGGVIAVISVAGGNEFRLAALPALSPSIVWASGVILAVAIVIPATCRASWLSLFPLVALSAATVFAVNPLMHGTGALTNSPIAQTIQALSQESNGRWVSDGIEADALLLAAGVPQLSGQIGAGPNPDAWLQLDPDRRFVDAWNRGSSYLVFAWDGTEYPTISNPQTEIIQVKVNPCAPVLDSMRLEWILSKTELTAPCLRLRGQGQWEGGQTLVYQRSLIDTPVVG